jgi:hypothetical protein
VSFSNFPFRGPMPPPIDHRLLHGANTLPRTHVIRQMAEMARRIHNLSARPVAAEYLDDISDRYVALTGETLAGSLIVPGAHNLGFNVFDQATIGTLDGSNTVFGVASGYVAGTLCVKLNGQWQQEGVDYDEAAHSTFIMVTPPVSGDLLRVHYVRTADYARVYHETPSGSLNGVNKTFTVVDDFFPGSLQVSLNALTLQEGEDFQSGALGFTMATAPASNDLLTASYQIIHDYDWQYQVVPSGSINGVNDTFTTPTSYASGSLAVFLNGLRQLITTDYAETDSTTITFVDPPLTGDTLWTIYRGSEPPVGG